MKENRKGKIMFFIPMQIKKDFLRKYGIQAGKRLNSLLKLMDSLLDSSEEFIIVYINKFFNQLEYRSDYRTWRKKDYWATPLEFLGKGQGDCEDYAVAKFLVLLMLGIPADRLFLTYVKVKKQAHLVVTYYDGDVPVVLDNYNKTITPLYLRTDLSPIYSFTAENLYIQKKRNLGKQIVRKPLKTQLKLMAIELEIIKEKYEV